LKRVIQKALQDELAELLLGGDVLDGSEVDVTADAHGLVINGKGNTPKAPADAPVH